MNTLTRLIPIPLGEIEDAQLDGYINALLPSQHDADLAALSVMLVERQRRCSTDEQSAWLRSCETLYLLATITFESKWHCPCGFEYSWRDGLPDLDIPPHTPLQELSDDFVCPRCLEATRNDFQACEHQPLYMRYAQDNRWTWSAFAMDTLNMSPGSASARKRTWEVYHVGLGWSVGMMRLAYKSCLGIAVAEMARSLPQGGDPELAILLLGDSPDMLLLGDGGDSNGGGEEVARPPASWYEVWEHVQARRREREAAEGMAPPMRFKAEELRGDGGEDVGFSVTAWQDDLPYNIGRFTWDKGLKPEMRDIFKPKLSERFGG